MTSGSNKRRAAYVWSTALVLLLVGGPWSPLQAGSLAEGKATYKRFCVGCHGSGGRGRVGSTPNFSRGEGLKRSNAELLVRIEKGKGLCPSFRGVLSEQKVTNVIRYLRTF